MKPSTVFGWMFVGGMVLLLILMLIALCDPFGVTKVPARRGTLETRTWTDTYGVMHTETSWK